ncbi:MAG: hypothetical protein ACREXY_15830 [Gammaproteobacteria bacterium]
MDGARQARLLAPTIAGVFDWSQLAIELPGSAPLRLDDLEPSRQASLRHEVHHFLHSVSTTLGLELHKSYLDDHEALDGGEFPGFLNKEEVGG